MEETEQEKASAEESLPEEHTRKIIGVRFRNGGKLYNFDPGELQVRVGDLVIVETENGMVCARVAGGMQQVSVDYLKRPLKKVLRKVSPEDLDVLCDNRVMEQQAKKYCYERIQSRNMQMKLVDVEYLFDRTKVIFYFTADGRVDFRELVRELAARLRTRIEMRQIGVRDEAKMIGGFGACGKEFCCKTFVKEFEPVSIKMAKQQDLTLNPSKISGACGRLMCCLSYENAHYSSFKKGLPKPGKNITTPYGPGRVASCNVIKGVITVQIKDGGMIELIEEDLDRLRQGLPLEKRAEPKIEDSPPVKEAAPAEKPKAERPAPREQDKPKPEPAARKRGSDKTDKGKKGLLSKIKTITGSDKSPEGEGEKKKRKRKRRRRPRPKGKGSAETRKDAGKQGD